METKHNTAKKKTRQTTYQFAKVKSMRRKPNQGTNKTQHTTLKTKSNNAESKTTTHTPNLHGEQIKHLADIHRNCQNKNQHVRIQIHHANTTHNGNIHMWVRKSKCPQRHQNAKKHINTPTIISPRKQKPIC